MKIEIINFLLENSFTRNRLAKRNQYEYYLTIDGRKTVTIMVFFENFNMSIYEYKSKGHYGVYFNPTDMYQIDIEVIKNKILKLIKKQKRLFKLKNILED